MEQKTTFLGIEPVLPSSDIKRDVIWYKKNAGFKIVSANAMYAVLKRENLCVHLQWHADTEDDPLLGGSVIKFFVKNILPIFNEFVGKGMIAKSELRMGTPWNTNEFGFYDLNKNAIFFVEDT
ncbi:hypothetical protein GGR42_003196 [Saonia flava]|uniref:Bleomycin resistance protein n=1 Tax=Saonia flava TaxID=523696 RepID=A0A846R413_9FLAO|nr:glyoxalase/bleomycin resistance/extradiol dioxygenase family protein [Saonia flava]NJB72705.1 hypothetical protein [Saonia flava]